MPSETNRKLAAIMFIDMVGYTSMMQKDEEKTHILVEHQRELVAKFVKEFSGKIHQYVGDGTLCVFDSVVKAIYCAIEIQKALLNGDITLRIGVHIGDIVYKGKDIYSDGINIASRLEPLAPSGGICISEQVLHIINSQKDLNWDLIEIKYLKNVKNPMKVYSVFGKGLIALPFKQKIQKLDTIVQNKIKWDIQLSIEDFENSTNLKQSDVIRNVTISENSICETCGSRIVESMDRSSSSIRYCQNVPKHVYIKFNEYENLLKKVIIKSRQQINEDYDRYLPTIMNFIEQ